MTTARLGDRGRRLATIDLGSNTVRLLVVEAFADGSWQPLLHDQRVTRLGEGLASTGRLSAAAMARTAGVVQEYIRRAAAVEVGEVRIVATSAMREATNAREFANALERATGASVHIVSGEEEARLTVRGIQAALGAPGNRLLAFDIGGGSTEFILAECGQVTSAVSLKLGVVPLAERHPFPGPVEPDRYARLVDEIRAQLVRELPPSIAGAAVSELIGTAGTATTLAALDLRLQRYDAARVQGHRMSRAAIARVAQRLATIDVAGRAALPCLEPGRADLIVPGVAIVVVALEVIGAGTLVVSDWGLREGIVTEALDTTA
jgi:exopolyphosphatase / guanosine-5'-triphosphate,3'-diphosphate pyrophosphatase